MKRQGRIIQKPTLRLRQESRIAGRNEQAVALVLQELHVAADGRGDDRLAGRHVFQDRVGHAFGARTQDGHIQPSQKTWHVLNRSGKEDLVG